METHGIPSRKDLRPYVLQGMESITNPATKHAIGNAVADVLELTNEVRALRDPSGNMPLIDWRVAWVLSELKQEGVLVQPQRGLWALATNGAVRGAGNGANGASEPPKRAGAYPADAAYRHFLEVSSCLKDGTLKQYVVLRSAGKRDAEARKESGFGKADVRDVNYLSHMTLTMLPDAVRDDRVRRGMPTYWVSPGLRDELERNEAAWGLFKALVTARYGKRDERLRAEHRRQQAQQRPKEPCTAKEAVGKLAERLDRIEGKQQDIDAKLTKLLEMWAE